jgi:predicted KAP-like P-loop ATPase
MDRMLARARQEQEWGTPQILDACITVAQVDSTQGQRLAGFLKDRPGAQIKASIVPKISDESWARNVLDLWLADENVSEPVKKAIKTRRR